MPNSPKPPKAAKSARRNTPKATWALPLAYWQDDIARAREQSVVTGEPIHWEEFGHVGENERALDELARAYEELQVADAELRAQNDELQDTRALIERERLRYAELFRRAPAAFIVTDANGHILQANAAAAALLDYRGDRLSRKPLTVFARDASRRRLRTAITSARANDERVSLRIDLVTRREKRIRVEISVVGVPNLNDDGRELLWLVVDQTKRLRRDVRRRRNAERLERAIAERTAELRQAQQIKDQLIATVSHEFRTVLSAIGGYAELLETGVRGALSDMQEQDVRRIQRAYRHLAALVDDLLSYSRLTRGTLELTITEIVASELVRAAAELVGPQARERQIAVCITPPHEALTLSADPERVRQIVVNLLANAVKFSNPGADVSVDCWANDTHVFVSVRDSGPGIPAEKLEEIFQPFVRLRSSSTPGTGLGLAICRDLARAMQGDVTVTSEIGIGSRFVLRLPRAMPNTAAHPPG